jgi:biotin carboxylase
MCLNELVALLRTASKALGIEGCVFHADVIFTDDDRFTLIEMSPRPAGMMIASELVPECTGVDFLGEAIELCLTGKGNFRPMYNRPAILHFWNFPNCVVNRVPSSQELTQVPGVKVATIGLHVGDVLRQPRDAGDILSNGHILIAADTFEEVESCFTRSINLFEVDGVLSGN